MLLVYKANLQPKLKLSYVSGLSLWGVKFHKERLEVNYLSKLFTSFETEGKHIKVFFLLQHFNKLEIELIQAKQGAAFQTLLWLIHWFPEWVTIFLPCLYGAAKSKRLEMVHPVINRLRLKEFWGFKMSKYIKFVSWVQKG